uniref:NAD-dependent epimerase/dehydratase domain-containing protein n=1 Tax=Salix viminalis TaxID=40686 RepID=A0A6N2NJY1_SALVM
MAFLSLPTRGNNVYGPNQYPEKLIPKFILLALKGEQLPIHGDGSNVRSFLYCEDVAEAFDVILHKGAIGHVYNIGTKKERRVLDVAEDICNLYGLDPEKSISYVQDRPFNDHRYFLDDQKLKMLGWQESTPWEAGLKMTMEWYTKNPDWWDDISAALHPHPRLSMISHSNDDSWISQKGLVSDAKEACSGLKFLIYGKTGWIGGLLGKLCKDGGIPFEYVNPTHVFNAAGVTGRPNVDWCESHKVETIRTNVGGTLTLADVCKEHDLLMMNFATGCIFEYDQDHQEGSGIGFKEEDKPNFTGSFYSKTKAMNTRTSARCESGCQYHPDLSNPRNFITKITRYSKVVNIPNSMTVLMSSCQSQLRWQRETAEEYGTSPIQEWSATMRS